ncbi:MAG: hypothetical protein WCO45_12140 [Pseudanabaena sp. ELA607]
MTRPINAVLWELIIVIVVAIGFTILCNALIALTGVGVGKPTQIVPQGWEWVDRIVGFVWIGLLTALGIAWWLLRQAEANGIETPSRLLPILFAVCLLYPFTFGLTPLSGLIGNVVIGAFAAWVAWKAYSLSVLAAILITPIAIWLSIATVYLYLLLRVNWS